MKLNDTLIYFFTKKNPYIYKFIYQLRYGFHQEFWHVRYDHLFHDKPWAFEWQSTWKHTVKHLIKGCNGPYGNLCTHNFMFQTTPLSTYNPWLGTTPFILAIKSYRIKKKQLGALMFRLFLTFFICRAFILKFINFGQCIRSVTCQTANISYFNYN